MATNEKLHSLADKIEKITHKRHVSPDQVLQIAFSVRPLEVILQEMILEEEPMH